MSSNLPTTQSKLCLCVSFVVSEVFWKSILKIECIIIIIIKIEVVVVLLTDGITFINYFAEDTLNPFQEPNFSKKNNLDPLKKIALHAHNIKQK